MRPANTKKGVRLVCPRCHPDKFPIRHDWKYYKRKKNVPCEDTGVCKPEMCIKALDCNEMKRLHKRQPTDEKFKVL